MEFISKYMRIIKSVLWVLIIVFAYKVYGSINGPIEFNKVKNERYLKVIDKLKDINGKCESFELDVNNEDTIKSLVKFVIKKFGKIDILFSRRELCILIPSFFYL